jgi:ribosomal protein S6--L-glutamate ligase/tetrahydromethanopterin:alpha-L-glutamate ligase
LKIGILGKRKGWHVISLQKALARHGIEAPCYPITHLIARMESKPLLTASKEPLDDCDALFVRAIPGGTLEQIIFRMDALHRLENTGLEIINSPTAIERGVDKYYTLTLMEDIGLRVPRTIVTERFDDAMAAFRELGEDVVIKPLFGSEGRGMVRVSDKDMAYRVFRALELGRYVYYIQEFIPHGNEDIRVFVIGREVVSAMVRRGINWKTNVAQGAKAVQITINDTLRDLSISATKALGADYAGIDFLPTLDGEYIIMEVNSIPGWRALQVATGVNVADCLVDYVLNKVG